MKTAVLPQNLVRTVSLQARYALMRASINSLASSTPPDLIKAAVKEGVWSPAHALIVIRRNQNPIGEQLSAFEALMPHLPLALMSDALAFVRELQDWQQPKALASVAPYLPEALIPEALNIARAIPSDAAKLQILSRFINHLPPDKQSDVLQEGLAIAQRLDEQWSGLSERGHFALILAQHGRTTEALELARVLEDPAARVKSLASIATFLPASRKNQALGEALNALPEVRNSFPPPGSNAEYEQSRHLESQLEVLRVILPHFSGRKREEAVLRSLDIINCLTRSQASWLQEIARYLSGNTLSKAVRLARSLQDPSERAEALAVVAACLANPGGQGTKPALLYRIGSAVSKWALFHRLTSKVVFREAMEAIAASDSGYVRTSSLKRLLAVLPAELRPQARDLIVRSVEEVRSNHETDVYADMYLSDLVPMLCTVGMTQEALHSIVAIEDVGYRIRTLERLSTCVPDDFQLALYELALDICQQANHEDWHLRDVAPIVCKLGFHSEALTLAHKIRSSEARLSVLLGLVSCLRGVDRDKVVKEVLDALLTTDSLGRPSDLMIAIVPYLSQAQLRELLPAANRISYLENRRQTLADMATRLHDLGHTREALACVQSIWDEEARLGTLESLALVLGQQGHHEEAIRTLLLIPNEEQSPILLMQLVISLPEHVREDVLRAIVAALARARSTDDALHDALFNLVHHLSDNERTRMREDLINLWGRNSVMYGNLRWSFTLLPFIAELGFPVDALKLAQSIEDGDSKLFALEALERYLPDYLRMEAQEQALHLALSSRDVEQPTILARLALHLPEAQKMIAMNGIMTLEWLQSYKASWRDALEKVAKGYSFKGQPWYVAFLEVVRKLAVLGYVQPAQDVIWIALDFSSNAALSGLSLIGYIPEAGLRSVLSSVQQMEESNYKSHALIYCVERLANLGYCDQSLDLARTIANPVSRASALLAVLRYIASEAVQLDILFEAVDATAAIDRKDSIIEDLLALLPDLGTPELTITSSPHPPWLNIYDELPPRRLLSNPVREAVLNTVLDIMPLNYGGQQANVSERLAPLLSQAQLRTAIEKAMQIEYVPERGLSSADTIMSLFVLIPHLTDPYKTQILGKLVELLSESPDLGVFDMLPANERYKLMAFTAQLTSLPATTLYPFWKKVIHALSLKPRPYLLSHLDIVAPVIGALGGARGLTETARAITDVGHWWP